MADLGAIGADVGWASQGSQRFSVRTIANEGVIKTVSGTVLDENGDPAARAVVVIHRDTRAVLAETVSDAGDGSYSVTVYTTDPVNVLVLDDDMTLADKIARTTPG